MNSKFKNKDICYIVLIRRYVEEHVHLYRGILRIIKFTTVYGVLMRDCANMIKIRVRKEYSKKFKPSKKRQK